MFANQLEYLTFFNLTLGLLSPLIWFVRDEVKFRLWGAAIPFCWCALNFAQGLLDSALILGVIGLRALAGLWLMNKGLQLKTAFTFVFVLFFTVMMIKGYEDLFSLLPWFAACLTTVAQLYLTGAKLRIVQCVGADGAWIVYNIVNQVWGHLFEKSVGVLINIWTVRKMIQAEKSAVLLTK